MSIQRLSAVDFEVLENPGVRSLQIVWPKNAPGALVTITRVTMDPGSVSKTLTSHSRANLDCGARPRYAFAGSGSNRRFASWRRCAHTRGLCHGVKNTGHEPFVYLAVTTPPQDFTAAYGEQRNSN